MSDMIRRIPTDSRNLLRLLEQAGEISVPQLRHMERGTRHEERVINRPHETIHERVDTTIEIYDFEE